MRAEVSELYTSNMKSQKNYRLRKDTETEICRNMKLRL